MISLKPEQYQLIGDESYKQFVHKVISVLQHERRDLVQDKPANLQFELVQSAVAEAEQYHITIEADLYEYIVCWLECGNDYLKQDIFAHKLEWLQSEYVPSFLKIKVIQEIIDSLPAQEERYAG